MSRFPHGCPNFRPLRWDGTGRSRAPEGPFGTRVANPYLAQLFVALPRGIGSASGCFSRMTRQLLSAF
jgi:hypothetical protein